MFMMEYRFGTLWIVRIGRYAPVTHPGTGIADVTWRWEPIPAHEIDSLQ
jgi:hypothetical protein